ncbi:adhesin [Actinoplanes auranticolor]|uniref:adhesin n=1 Tax=Actinoplanes auranticolor TaxID=47988 RepID=UPI001BB42F43|nr:adhesin [Actinoplanes auranticolor]
MRSTVGPLPSAVYWRRRAVVLGALLLGVIVLFVSCSGGDDKDSNRGKGASSQAPLTPASASQTPEDEPSFTDPGPGAGNPSLPDPGELTASGAAADPSAGAGANPGDGTQGGVQGGTQGGDTNVAAGSGTCTDAEMSVTPVPAVTTVRRGAPVAVRLKIKNISARTCTRDVGADLQELYIGQGAGRVWSSDTCSTVKGSEVRTFPPNSEREYNVTWNGKQANKCAGGLATGTAPAAGQYEMRFRLGAKISAPVALTITA